MNTAIAVAALAAAAPILARATETWPGLAPCALCLWQRWPYWAAAGLALLAIWLPRRLLLTAAGLAVLGSGAIAVLHLGVEWGLWPSPLPGCLAPTAGQGATVDDLLAGLAARPAKPCDEPAFLVPGLPLSMAAMNLIYAVALGGFTLAAARRDGHT